MHSRRDSQQKIPAKSPKSKKQKIESSYQPKNYASVLEKGKAAPEALSQAEVSVLQRAIGNQQIASLTSSSERSHLALQEHVQRVVTLPTVHITGDPNFYIRAQKLNQLYSVNLPIAGWPYDATLSGLWQSGNYDEFADKVRELQETKLGVTGKSADGVLGPQTAKLMLGNKEGQEVAPPPAQAATESKEEKMAYVMNLLINKYGYPANGAAGLAGNLYAESGLITNRIEGSKPATPMKAKDTQDKVTDFTPEDAMNRKYKVQGPKKPGIGLAQWTTAGRRKGLFEHEFGGKKLGAAILSNLDAQVDYLVKELESKYKGVNAKLKNAESVEAASDEVVFNFERPGSVLKGKTDKDGKKTAGKTLRSRDDPAVQPVLNTRRKLAGEALSAFNKKQ